MRAKIWKVFDTIRQSYWFIPLVMALGAMALSIAIVALDRAFRTDVFEGVPWLYANQPAGARALLQTIAGSMITVAGVTFSITVAVVANTSAQFGPRLMTNFMHDRGNQVTFGVFVATFLYCLLVLTTVRGGGGTSAAEVFVPNLAVHGGLLMALASLGVLIYFIHHIPESIHISQMIAGVGRKLTDRINVFYPAHVGEGTPNGDGGKGENFAPNLPMEDVKAVYPRTTGFVQHLDGKQLMDVAQKHNLVLWIVKRPGDFATPETALVLAKPAGLVSDHVSGNISATFVVGNRRTPSQDLLFPVNQLVEVAARALSPGVNDPYTATHCIDWLTAALAKLAGRQIPSRYRFDDAGDLRLVASPVDFEDVADAMFGQLRPYVQRDRNAALHMLNTMMDLLVQVRTDSQKATVRRHCEALRLGCMSDLPHPEDQDAIDRIFADAALRWGPWPPAIPAGEKDGQSADGAVDITKAER